MLWQTPPSAVRVATGSPPDRPARDHTAPRLPLLLPQSPSRAAECTMRRPSRPNDCEDEGAHRKKAVLQTVDSGAAIGGRGEPGATRWTVAATRFADERTSCT